MMTIILHVANFRIFLMKILGSWNEGYDVNVLGHPLYTDSLKAISSVTIFSEDKSVVKKNDFNQTHRELILCRKHTV